MKPECFPAPPTSIAGDGRAAAGRDWDIRQRDRRLRAPVRAHVRARRRRKSARACASKGAASARFAKRFRLGKDHATLCKADGPELAEYRRSRAGSEGSAPGSYARAFRTGVVAVVGSGIFMGPESCSRAAIVTGSLTSQTRTRGEGHAATRFASKIANLTLDANLVILSACNTAASEGMRAEEDSVD